MEKDRVLLIILLIVAITAIAALATNFKEKEIIVGKAFASSKNLENFQTDENSLSSLVADAKKIDPETSCNLENEPQKILCLKFLKGKRK